MLQLKKLCPLCKTMYLKEDKNHTSTGDVDEVTTHKKSRNDDPKESTEDCRHEYLF